MVLFSKSITQYRKTNIHNSAKTWYFVKIKQFWKLRIWFYYFWKKICLFGRGPWQPQFCTSWATLVILTILKYSKDSFQSYKRFKISKSCCYSYLASYWRSWCDHSTKLFRVTNPVKKVNDRWPAIILSAAIGMYKCPSIVRFVHWIFNMSINDKG